MTLGMRKAFPFVCTGCGSHHQIKSKKCKCGRGVIVPREYEGGLDHFLEFNNKE